MEALKALTLTIICTKFSLVSKVLSFYYTAVFTGLYDRSNWQFISQIPAVAQRCSQIFSRINRTTPVLEFLFLKNCRPQTWSFIENKTFRQGCFSVNCVKFLRTQFYKTPSVVAYSCNTLKKNKIILSSFSSLRFAVGPSINDVRTSLGIFGTPLPLSRPAHIWLTIPLPLSVWTQGWHYLKYCNL